MLLFFSRSVVSDSSVTLRLLAHQAPLPMGFSRNSPIPWTEDTRILEWVAMPSSRGSKPRFPTLQVDSLPAELPGKLHCGRQLNFFPQGLLKTLCIAAFLAGQLHTNLVIFSLYNSFVSFFFGHTCNLQDLRSPSRAQTQAHSGESTES